MVLYIIFTIKLKFKSDASISCKGFSLTDAVMDAISSSAGSMISICSAIVFFSAIIALLPSLNPILYAVLEISNITSLEGSGMLFFVMVTVLLSFGGLCVHMQILCMSGGSFSFKRFYLTRPIQLLLTAAFSSIGYLIVQNHISIDADASNNIEFSSTGSIIPFICVCGMVLIALTHKKSDRM
ncbi:MAG: hypothetical protein LUH23_06585 [Oscillospiraceae bacterium]|nr:hypothetical protein [Oscillospiraceae bacterium]